jgi:hypothetical protein
MKLLLDTHSFIFYVDRPDALPSTARAALNWTAPRFNFSPLRSTTSKRYRGCRTTIAIRSTACSSPRRFTKA